MSLRAPSRWLLAATAFLGGFTATTATGGPPPECLLDDSQRESVRQHNTMAKQRFEEENFLDAAHEWLAAGAALPRGSGACGEQYATRVDLALRSLESYVGALRYAASDLATLRPVRVALEAYASDPQCPEELRGQLSALTATLACIEAAAGDGQRALDCTEEGRASKPAPTVTPPPPPRLVPAAPEARIEQRRKRLVIGIGVAGGLGAAALVTGIATWAQARTDGPLHHEIAAAWNSEYPNLTAPDDYCEVARAEPETLRELCDRHSSLRAVSITSYVLSGAFAVAGITLATLLGTSRQPRRTARRALHPELARIPGGLWIGGSGHF